MSYSGSMVPQSSGPEPGRISLLWSYARPHLPALILSLVLALVTSASQLASPLATRSVLDALAGGGSLLNPVLVLVVLLVVGGAIGWWQWVMLGTLAERIVYEARQGMLTRFMRARVFPLLRRPAGELVTRVTSDSVLLREAASSSVVGIINGTALLIGTLVMMAILDVVLVLATVAAVAVVAAVSIVLMPEIGRAQSRSQAALGSLGAELEGNLRAIKTVKAAGSEQRQLDRLTGHALASRDESVRAVRREAMVWTVAGGGIQAAIIVILGVGAWRVSEGEMTVSTLVAFLLYAFVLLEPVSTLSENLTAFQSGLAAAGRIRELEQLEQEDTPVGAGVSSAVRGGGGAVMELRSVTAGYDPAGEPAVRDLELRIPSRGHLALVGPSGAGKTTVFSLLLGFLNPQSGQLLLQGVPYAEVGLPEVRRRLAYVEQETPVVPGTIRDNLTFLNAEVTEQQILDVLDQIRLRETVLALPNGLDTPLSDSSVSGGQRQRIALARALLADPDVLLLDEATAQVDGLTETAIHDAVRRHAANATVVTIAHRLSTVIDADEIVVMEEGRIAARGTHQELLATSELYRSLVRALRIDAEAGVERAEVEPVGGL
ncbi:ABC transporter ATP-binding protein [Kribbella hippodromi]|uniref:ABC transporter ATP-binding protein n=2 Tax=Kribbella hippodromi TaxID=434347 RepID=A0ABN2DSG1_9ACTN